MSCGRSRPTTTPSTTSLVTFPAEAGVEYYIAVDGYRGACGSVVLNWSTPEPPENDDVASARTIGENAGTLEDDNTYATYEPDEPPHARAAGGKSLWYASTAPGTHTATFDTHGSSFDTLLAVYVADDPANPEVRAMQSIAANDDVASGEKASAVTFPTEQGVTYLIAVDGYQGECGPLVLNWAAHSPPPNNMLNDAEELPARRAGRRHESLRHAGAGRAAPRGRSGVARSGSPGRPSPTPRPRSTPGGATSTRCSPSTRVPRSISSRRWRGTTTPLGGVISELRFAARAGTDLRDRGRRLRRPRRVGGAQLADGAGPGDDHVAGATAIAGRSGAISGDVRGATHEPDEPGHADSWGLGSVWYRWSAPQAGTVSFDAEDSQFGPALAVYRLDPERSGMSALEPVEARYPRIEKDRRDRLEFVAAENATYLIAVDQLHPGTGSGLELTWTMSGSAHSVEATIEKAASLIGRRSES